MDPQVQAAAAQQAAAHQQVAQAQAAAQQAQAAAQAAAQALGAQPANLAAAIQAAVQAAMAAMQQQQPVRPFSDVPAGAGNDAWDLQSASGIKLYAAATAKLPVQFDNTMEKMQEWLDAAQERANSYGMANILMIPVGPQGANRRTLSLIEN